MVQNEELIKLITSANHPFNTIIKTYIKNLINIPSLNKDEDSPQKAVQLKNISKLLIQSSYDSEIYYFCLPSANQQRNLPTSQPSAQNNQQSLSVQKPQTTSATNGTKWSNDDH